MYNIKKSLLLKGVSFFLTFSLIAGMVTPSFASTPSVYTNDAIRLNRIGLFLGTGTGFQLDSSIDRLQGAALFIRLMGEEKEALEEGNSHFFKDVPPGWATPYVAQMVAQGYSNGISQDSYGTGGMTADQFASYILRALGYEESSGDFVWSNALRTLLSLNIITSEDYSRISKGTLTRDYAVGLASSALDAPLKGQDKTLYEQLMDQKALKEYSRLTPEAVPTDTPIRSYDDMTRVFQRMRANLQYSVTLDTKGIALADIKKWMSEIINTASADVWGWNLVSTYIKDTNYPIKVSVRWLYSDGYEVSYSYLYPDKNLSLSDKNEELRSVVDRFLKENISSGMTDKQKIKAVHDYLIKTTRYDSNLLVNLSQNSDQISDSYTAYGALVEHLAVCDGYAKAFNMFMDILRIPSDRVVGLSLQNNNTVNHAWNRVYMDGAWQYIDVTWDDPVPDRGNAVQYDYYMITERALSKDHSWNSQQFIPRYY